MLKELYVGFLLLLLSFLYLSHLTETHSGADRLEHTRSPREEAETLKAHEPVQVLAKRTTF